MKRNVSHRLLPADLVFSGLQSHLLRQHLKTFQSYILYGNIIFWDTIFFLFQMHLFYLDIVRCCSKSAFQTAPIQRSVYFSFPESQIFASAKDNTAAQQFFGVEISSLVFGAFVKLTVLFDDGCNNLRYTWFHKRTCGTEFEAGVDKHCLVLYPLTLCGPFA